MSYTGLYLIRHAEVESRYHKVFGGRIDMGISPVGHEQAKILAGIINRKPVDAVYASPMKRVQQTLEYWSIDGTPQTVVLPGLREVDFGDWTGHRWDEVAEKFGVSAYEWLQHLENGTLPNGESGADLRARVEPCLREILGRHGDQTVAIVCHGGVIRMLLSILLHLPLSKMAAFDIEYASLTQLKLFPHRAEIQLLNFTPWRDLCT